MRITRNNTKKSSKSEFSLQKKNFTTCRSADFEFEREKLCCKIIAKGEDKKEEFSYFDIHGKRCGGCQSAINI